MHRLHHIGLCNSRGQKRRRYLLLINDNSNMNFSDCKYLICLLCGEEALKEKKIRMYLFILLRTGHHSVAKSLRSSFRQSKLAGNFTLIRKLWFVATNSLLSILISACTFSTEHFVLSVQTVTLLSASPSLNPNLASLVTAKGMHKGGEQKLRYCTRVRRTETDTTSYTEANSQKSSILNSSIK